MVKLSKKDAAGTSFHDVTVTATPQQLLDLLGPAQWGDNDGRDKTNFGWVCETADGIIFTIYDWKYYRALDLNEEVMWHIGGRSFFQTHEAAEVLQLALQK
jgi:L-ascorbate metabolism protein UlaG (beta-lactamase superfamily)